VAASNVVRIGGISGGALPTRLCVSCGASPGPATVSIPRTYPFGLLFGIAFALPLLLALALDIAWGSRDLYSIMAGTGGRNAMELAVFRTLPVVVAALWSIPAMVALEIFCRRAGLRLSLCRPCAGRQSRRRAALVAVLALSFIALATVLYLVPVLALYDRKWGIFFAPWAILAALLAGETPLAGIRIRAISDGVWRLLGARAFATAVAAEHPERVVTESATSFWPPRLELWSLIVPTALAALAILGPRLERFPLECPYGTYPLSHRSGLARIIGCRAPDGSAHGYSRGGAGAWNSHLHSPGFSGTWWFGQPHGEFAFLDLKGRVRAQGRFVLGQPRGRWQVLDEWGTVLEELEVLAAPLRTVVHRAHPHLKCPPSEIEASGSPAWGTRSCPRYDRPAPFVRTENAIVVETGMR
jgi:hypothetical protein